MTNLVVLGDSAADNEFLQLAQSHKHDSGMICTLAELRPGLFALYQHAQVLYVGEDLDELLAVYRARPKWTSPTRGERTHRSARHEKTTAAERAANTAALLAKLRGEPNV